MKTRISVGRAEERPLSEQTEGRNAESETHASGFFTRPQSRSAQKTQDQPRILLGLAEARARLELAATLRANSHVLDFDPRRSDWSERLPSTEVDVVVIDASNPSLSCAALIQDPKFGFPEIVFAVDRRYPAQRLALLSRGYRHVVSSDHLASWLLEHLAALCALARARRIVLAACPTQTPVTDFVLGTPANGNLSLHLAETQFRETFLRALLVEHGSRRGAAEAAGVPYRSFCEMLRKLGI